MFRSRSATALTMKISMILLWAPPPAVHGQGILVALVEASPSSGLPVCQDLGLEVRRLYVQFNSPQARLLSVGFADLGIDDPDGMFQVPYTEGGRDTAPLEDYLPSVPYLACDSFVTFNLEFVADGSSDCTQLDPSFDSVVFNDQGYGAGIAGGWFCSDPSGGQGDPDPVNLRVLIAQLSAWSQFNLSGTLIAFVQGEFDDSTNCSPVVPIAGPCPPDINGNGLVNQQDLQQLLNAWGTSGSAADLNGDDAVDAADLALVLGNWGPCGTLLPVHACGLSPGDCNLNGIEDPCDVDCGTPGEACDVPGCGLSPDCNADGIPDECIVLERDCNSNAIPDGCDIADGTSPDCNGNEIPDECVELEQDCNSNGTPDGCDIADGTSPDCDGNEIPDECIELEQDCNSNGIPDGCDITDGTSGDCNNNQIPDDCESDIDDDGIIDTCDSDIDGDGVLNVADNCPTDFNPGQEDANGDGIGDACSLPSLNVAIIDSPVVTSGGVFPLSGGYQGGLDAMNFTALAVGEVNAMRLSAFDTVLLNLGSAGLACTTSSLSTYQKEILIEFVGTGGKLIIYDSECPAADYSWLPFAFTTNNPGQQGAHGQLSISEENVLSSTAAGDPAFVDAWALGSATDAVGDMNVLVTFDPSWCLDMAGTNITPVTGPVHAYARYGFGLIIYNGLDIDYMVNEPSPPAPHGLSKIWLLELQTPFNPTPLWALPCGVAVIGIAITPLEAARQVGQTHTVTATVTDAGGVPQPGVVVNFTIVDGPNAGADGDCTIHADCRTDDAGDVTFSYSGCGGPGVDHIRACFSSAGGAVCSQTVSTTWFVGCPADLNEDDYVDARDLALLLAEWGSGNSAPADLNFDGVTNAYDLEILLGSWGPCGSPGSLATGVRPGEPQSGGAVEQ